MITANAGEFGAALPNGGVLIGLDLGTQTIGTAFCDAGWRIAGPGKTLRRGKFAVDSAAIAAQKRLVELQGQGGVYYCGAYFGSGFHEDGLQAGLWAAEAAGARPRPWKRAGQNARLALPEALGGEAAAA